MTPRRPLIRYHGGKWRLAPWIISHFPKHRVYVEPFGGGGSVLLRKERSYAEIYNDLDSEVVNLFRVVRDDGLRLREALRCTPFARAEFLGAWLPADSSFEQARRSVVRAYMGFGSGGVSESRPNGRVMTGFRSNTSRAYSTPASNWHSFPQALELIVERLRGVVIENREAVQVMSAHDERTTLHYVDPPYVGSARGDGCGEYRHEMTDEQHQELVNTFQGYRVSLLFPVTRQLCTMKYSKGGFVLSVGQWLTGRGLEPRFYG